MGKFERIGAPAMQERQTASAVMMVKPLVFGFNPETAVSNRFASPPLASDRETAGIARREFFALAERLSEAGVAIHLLDDPLAPAGPDAVFPNNWVSFHADGTIVTYPMAAASRRVERRMLALEALLRAAGFVHSRHLDLSQHEGRARYLEGTGSLVLDRSRRRAYACLSSRTHADVIADFDARLGYSTLTFAATDAAGVPLYHTNVMMSLGTRFAAVCLESVDPAERPALIDDLEAGGRAIVEVSREQMSHFACNILELEDRNGRPLVAMSSGAFASLAADQRRALETLSGELVHSPIPTLERVGGGGVRCMLAELHLPKTDL